MTYSIQKSIAALRKQHIFLQMVKSIQSMTLLRRGNRSWKDNMESLELFPESPPNGESIDSFDDRVLAAVRTMPSAEKKAVMIFAMSAAEYDHTKLLVKLCEHSTLLRANIHKVDMTSKEFHILEELLDEICDFSKFINTAWENWVIRRIVP